MGHLTKYFSFREVTPMIGEQGAMENFRGKPLDGEWWTADRPDDHYKGILLFDEEHHGTLTLRGTEDQLASLPIDPLPRTYFGRLCEPRCRQF